MRDPLSEERLAAAWTSAEGERPAGCPPEDRFWEASRGALPPGDVERLLDHTASCPHCALALSAAIAVHGESGLARAALAEPPSLWDRLRMSILRPEAALAYLFLLALLVPLTRLGREANGSAPAALRGARIVAFESASATRGAGAEAPVPIDLPAEDTLVLRLFLDTEELDPATPLTVRVADVGESTLPRGAVGAEGSLDVTVATAALPRGVPLTVEVRQGSRVVFTRRVIVP